MPDALTVRAATPGTTVQDLGRPGLARWGVARSGAADRAALRRANRLVGNVEDAAGLECPLGGLTVVADVPVVVAVTGAPATVRVGARVEGGEVALLVAPGVPVSVGTPWSGLRCYLAVRGGLGVAAVLGSRAWDSLGALGPPPVAVGDVLPVGPVAATCGAWFEPVPVPAPPSGPVGVRVVLGPRADAVTPAALATFLTTAWGVGPASDRIGLRLTGPRLERLAPDVASEPMLPGAVQVPADGQPILLGPDCGTTGGYPVVAVVLDADLDRLGQVRPGDRLRFVPVRVG